MNNAAANDVTASATLAIGETREVNGCRIHRFAGHVRITDLACAGKRGKHCVQVTITTDEDFHANGLLSLLVAGKSVGRVAETAEFHGLDAEYAYPRGVDVLPANAKVEVRTAALSLCAEPAEFFAQNVADVDNYSSAMTRTRTDARKLHAWAKGLAPSVLAGLTFRDVVRAASNLGVSLHQWCAMD
jgi:hypothetical protein